MSTGDRDSVVLIGGLGGTLVANAVLSYVGLAPLERVTRRMAAVDLHRLGQSLSANCDAGPADPARTGPRSPAVNSFHDLMPGRFVRPGVGDEDRGVVGATALDQGETGAG